MNRRTQEHVHLIIQISARESVAEVVRILKGGTSRIIRNEFPELEEFLWGDSFWADGYFAESVDQVDEAVVKRYIREHRKAIADASGPETLGFSPERGLFRM